MRIVITVALTITLLMVAGCGSDDCSGQSAAPCPSTATSVCVDGKLECVPLDLAGTAPDFSRSFDLSQPGD